MKKVSLIFAAAFISNLIWENAHAFLYAHYMNGRITEMILLRAALADALMITLITLPFALFPRLRRRSWSIIPAGIIVAVGIEWWALDFGRWAYNIYMPIIPLLSVGLTPTMQLGLLGYLSFKMQEKVFDQHTP